MRSKGALPANLLFHKLSASLASALASSSADFFCPSIAQSGLVSVAYVEEMIPPDHPDKDDIFDSEDDIRDIRTPQRADPNDPDVDIGFSLYDLQETDDDRPGTPPQWRDTREQQYGIDNMNENTVPPLSDITSPPTNFRDSSSDSDPYVERDMFAIHSQLRDTDSETPAFNNWFASLPKDEERKHIHTVRQAVAKPERIPQATASDYFPPHLDPANLRNESWHTDNTLQDPQDRIKVDIFDKQKNRPLLQIEQQHVDNKIEAHVHMNLDHRSRYDLFMRSMTQEGAFVSKHDNKRHPEIMITDELAQEINASRTGR